MMSHERVREHWPISRGVNTTCGVGGHDICSGTDRLRLSDIYLPYSLGVAVVLEKLKYATLHMDNGRKELDKSVPMLECSVLRPLLFMRKLPSAVKLSALFLWCLRCSLSIPNSLMQQHIACSISGETLGRIGRHQAESLAYSLASCFHCMI